MAIKLGLRVFPPLWSAFWRMLLAVIALALYAVRSAVPLQPKANETRGLFTLGLLFTVQIGLLNLGANYTSPAFAVVLLNSYPMFANFVAHFSRAEERLSGRRLLGLALAFSGIVYVFQGTPQEKLAPHPKLGNTLMLTSAALLGLRTVYTRMLVQAIDPVRAVVWMTGVSTPFFLLAALAFEPPLLEAVSASALAAIIYQALAVAGFCFIAWTRLLRKHPAGAVSMFAFTVPLFGVLLSHVVISEPVSCRLIAGATLVTAGIALGTAPGKRS